MNEAAEATGFAQLWSSLADIGRDPSTGGYRRFAWTPSDLACRDWFSAQAADRGLTVETDRNGNQWAWWLPGSDEPGGGCAEPAARGALAVGSHLDSVPDGGAFDGPLGVISALSAVDLLRARGWKPHRPVVIANFTDEEGARFGVACAGSRLMTGQLDAARARALRDADGVRMADAMEAAGQDPDALGRDDARLGAIGRFVELHIEQGRDLIDRGAPLGVAGSIWPHGRWRFDFTGEANHAGTTALDDRRDPMLTYAHTVLSARKKARLGGALATFGKVSVEPNGTNAIASRVTAWLDSRAADEKALDAVVERIEAAGRERCERDGTTLTVVNESRTAIVEFNHTLRETIRDTLAERFGPIPQLSTGAGHDAGILAAELPTAMLFVRNPSGLSHTPAEHAETADCLTGVAALAEVVARLAGAPGAGSGV
ncbi:allantoate amidohydrolase [Actinocrinis puniceicyclus]|uniref:Allantoate amidohydrolase n=1 Tax=Actinocrinis puniceicyclus TaxID=977794 RepID=A0A8J8B9S6_9ACTN|nr:allantoate amidohydrolase [Actinocrinis puniceicyclus]MBS2962152.1 allantoate amidohydrolase [Actinocrinis puniceicyclus]